MQTDYAIPCFCGTTYRESIVKSYSVRLIRCPCRPVIIHGCVEPSHAGLSDVTTLAIWPTGDPRVTGSSLFASQNSTLTVCTAETDVIRFSPVATTCRFIFVIVNKQSRDFVSLSPMNKPLIITGPPNGPVLFCSMASVTCRLSFVVACNIAGCNSKS